MALKSSELAESMRGKHDMQLEKELREALKNAGVSQFDSTQTERRIGRIKVKMKFCLRKKLSMRSNGRLAGMHQDRRSRIGT